MFKHAAARLAQIVLYPYYLEESPRPIRRTLQSSFQSNIVK